MISLLAMDPVLDVFIVNWNAGLQLRRCLDSIRGAGRDGFELGRVVVVDNASGDRSADALDSVGFAVDVIRNGANRGFAAACNQGARGSRADYLLFLNPDVALEENSLEVPVAFMEGGENAGVGVCGVQLRDSKEIVRRSCARFPRARDFLCGSIGLQRAFPMFFPAIQMGERDHKTSGPVDHVTGAFYLVRRETFELLGGFDERFFVYLEDLDFSLRARQAGWKSYYLATARAYHKGGGCSEQAKAERLCYSLRSKILYGYKHFGRFGATGVLLATILVEPLSRLALAAGHGSFAEIRETVRGYSMLWKSSPTLLRAGIGGVISARSSPGGGRSAAR